MTTADTQTPNRVVAVVDIGASAIRMAIAEVTPRGEIHILETPSKPVAIGRDVFTSGRISRPTRLEVINVLRGFAELMQTYQVSLKRIIATSALREALDRDTFLDWVYIRTGLDIEVIEGIEENQLTFAAVQRVVGEQLADADDSLIMEVGGGSTEVMIMHEGDITLSQALPLGVVRMQQRPESMAANPTERVRLYRREVEGAIENISRDVDLEKITYFVALGGDVRFMARSLVDTPADGPAGRVVEVGAKALQKFARDVAKMRVDDLVDEFGLPYANAETLAPTMTVYSTFLEATSADQVVVPMVSIRDGLLLEVAGMLSGQRRSDFSRQVVASAKALGRKYQYDEKHSLHVTKLALRLFDELDKEHTLGQREKLLLEVAGILHDVGVFISNRAHHKHGRYVLAESDLFGLRKAEKNIAAEVVRYHRKATPKPTHLEYMALTRSDRVIVSKLAAILRVADALDRAHLQRISDFDIVRRAEQLVVRVRGVDDLSVEQGGLKAKGDLFEDVFGMTLVLEKAAAS